MPWWTAKWPAGRATIRSSPPRDLDPLLYQPTRWRSARRRVWLVGNARLLRFRPSPGPDPGCGCLSCDPDRRRADDGTCYPPPRARPSGCRCAMNRARNWPAAALSPATPGMFSLNGFVPSADGIYYLEVSGDGPGRLRAGRSPATPALKTTSRATFPPATPAAPTRAINSPCRICIPLRASSAPFRVGTRSIATRFRFSPATPCKSQPRR